MSLTAVEPPEPSVRDDRPVSVSLFNGGDDLRTGVLVGMVRVLKVRPIEPATPWIDEGGAQVASPGRIFKEEVRLGVITASSGGLRQRQETKMPEDGFEELRCDLRTPLGVPTTLGVLVEVANLLEHAGGVLPPGGIFLEPLTQEVVREEPSVLEELASEDGVVEYDTQFVELVESVLVRPSELPERPHVLRAWLPPVDAEDFRDDLDLVPATGSGLLLGLLVEQDELQGVEGSGEDDEIILVALPNNADQVVADFGGQRLGLNEQHSEEPVLILRQEFDRANRRCRVA